MLFSTPDDGVRYPSSMQPFKADARPVVEMVIDARVYRVAGKALQRLIVPQRAELRGPKGYLFKQRPMIG